MNERPRCMGACCVPIWCVSLRQLCNVSWGGGRQVCGGVGTQPHVGVCDTQRTPRSQSVRTGGCPPLSRAVLRCLPFCCLTHVVGGSEAALEGTGRLRVGGGLFFPVLPSGPRHSLSPFLGTSWAVTQGQTAQRERRAEEGPFAF